MKNVLFPVAKKKWKVNKLQFIFNKRSKDILTEVVANNLRNDSNKCPQYKTLKQNWPERVIKEVFQTRHGKIILYSELYPCKQIASV